MNVKFLINLFQYLLSICGKSYKFLISTTSALLCLCHSTSMFQCCVYYCLDQYFVCFQMCTPGCFHCRYDEDLYSNIFEFDCSELSDLGVFIE